MRGLAVKIHTGNRLESLIAALAERVREPLQTPLDRETIIVRSTGMERWVIEAVEGPT